MTILTLYTAITILIGVGIIIRYHIEENKKFSMTLLMAYVILLSISPIGIPVLIGMYNIRPRD